MEGGIEMHEHENEKNVRDENDEKVMLKVQKI